MFKWTVYSLLTTVAALIFFLIGMLAVLRAADAQSGFVCMPQSDMRAFLFNDFRETLRVRLVNQRGIIHELYASPDGSWTMTYYHASGLLCTGSTGKGYEDNPPMMMPPPPKEAES